MLEKIDAVVAGIFAWIFITTLDGGSSPCFPAGLRRSAPRHWRQADLCRIPGLPLHKLGIKTSLMAKVGGDWIGRMILELWGSRAGF